MHGVYFGGGYVCVLVCVCVCGVDLAVEVHSFFMLASFKLVYYTRMPIYHEG